MRDVARAAGVSVMTVSRVVNADPTVRDDTRARVKAVIAQLGYRRNSMARSLRPNQSTGLIGLIVANLANPFYSQLAVAVEKRVRESGYALIVANTSEDAEREGALVDDLLSRGVDGLLLVPVDEQHEYLAAEVERGTSVVFVTRPPTDLAVDAAFVDDFGGARAGVGALLGRGHTRIGFLGHAAMAHTAGERLRGYRAACAAADVAVDAALVRSDLASVDDAAAAAAELLGTSEPPTALFTTNNRLTVGALRAIRRLGADVGLVGFDDVEFADLTDVPFTVVSYDAEALGEAAADLITSRIEGRQGPPQRRIISTQLVERGR